MSLFGFNQSPFINLILAFIFIIIIINIFTPIIKFIINYLSPLLTVNAKVVSKREKILTLNDDTIFKSNYYITFSIDSNDHLELKTSKKQYNCIFYGDSGKLTFRGKRILSFVLQ